MQMRQTPDDGITSSNYQYGSNEGSASPTHQPANSNGPTSSSDRHRRGNGAAASARYKGKGSSRPVSHQKMQRRVPADRGISAYQHEHTTSQRNGPVVRRPLRTVPLVPLEGTSDTPQRKESAQAVWSYVGDAENITPVTPTAPSFSSGQNEAINADGFIPPQAPLDHNTTGVHRYNSSASSTFSHMDETFLDTYETTGVYDYDTETDDSSTSTNLPDSGATWSMEPEDNSPRPPNRYRRAYGSISPVHLRRDQNTDETTHQYSKGNGSASPTRYTTPIPPAHTDALAGRSARTDALVGGGHTGTLAVDARYLPTTAPLGSLYDGQQPILALRSQRDTVFLMLLTLLVLSIIGIMSCNYLLSMYHA